MALVLALGVAAAGAPALWAVERLRWDAELRGDTPDGAMWLVLTGRARSTGG